MQFDGLITKYSDHTARHPPVELPTRHGTPTAVDDISLTIGTGEMLDVVGESGAGKAGV